MKISMTHINSIDYNSQYYEQFAVHYDFQLLLMYKIQQYTSLGRKQERKAFDQEMKMMTIKHNYNLGRKKERTKRKDKSC